MGNRAGWLQNSESLLIDRSAARFHENQNVPNLILGSSSQSFAEHDDLNMHLDPGFHAVFGCWPDVCSAEIKSGSELREKVDQYTLLDLYSK